MNFLHGVSELSLKAAITQTDRPTAPADVSIQYDHVKYNVTTKGNKFVGAGPEVDQAWREISYDSKDSHLRLLKLRTDIIVVGDQWMSKSDITKLGMPESHLKVDHPTTGVEGYRVGMEVFHQLHCINLLRRVTYKEYYEPLGGEFGKGEEALRHHTGKLFSLESRITD